MLTLGPLHPSSSRRRSPPRMPAPARRGPARCGRVQRHGGAGDRRCAPSASTGRTWSSRPIRSTRPRRPRSGPAAGRCSPTSMPPTFALSPETLTAALTPDTAAVVLVHVGGLITPGMPTNCARLCEQRGITLVEDAAHAHGSTCDGRFAGSFGAAAAFSFYPTKVVTCGEGGMILTSSADLADEARIYRDQGKGSVHRQSPCPARLRLADERAERGHRPGAPAQDGRVHRARRREVAARYDKAPGRAGRAGAAQRAGRLPRATSTSTSRCCRRAPTGPVQAGAGRRARRPAGRRGLRPAAAPSAGVRRVSPGLRCRSPRTCAPGTSACRCTRTCATTRSIRCWPRCAPSTVRSQRRLNGVSGDATAGTRRVRKRPCASQ